MNIRETILSIFTTERNRLRRKSGITDLNGYPTDEGVKAVINWWLKNSPDSPSSPLTPSTSSGSYGEW